jgi:ATPase family associated with various cellular activities (AAA)
MTFNSVQSSSAIALSSAGSNDQQGTARELPGPGGPEIADVGRLWRRALRGVVAVARADEQRTLTRILQEHLGLGCDQLPVLEESWPPYDHVNIQAGVDAWLCDPTRTWQLQGITAFQHAMFGLADLLTGGGMSAEPHGPRPGNVAWVNVASGPGGAVRACVRCGLYLVVQGEQRTVLLVRGAQPEFGRNVATVEIASTDQPLAEAAAKQIRELAVRHNVFRAQVLSFGAEMFGPGQTLLQFHDRPRLTEDQVVLDRQTLRAIDRQVLLISRHRERLLAAGQHLKRGLLLYGPPGVGKTHTVRYLMSSLTDTTVIQLTGTALHLIAEACSVARTLQPAMVVVEDVDLIAEDRGMHPGQHPLLFQLLNEMDGLAENSDVLFVLTTNRADLLEPALAARPGRVDQAVELTLPDLSARRTLFELYRGSLHVDIGGLDEILLRTEGVTASFIKEMLRRAAVSAAERAPATTGVLPVSAADLRASLDELLDQGNAMTRILLGSGEGRHQQPSDRGLAMFDGPPEPAPC